MQRGRSAPLPRTLEIYGLLPGNPRSCEKAAAVYNSGRKSKSRKAKVPSHFGSGSNF